MSGAGRPSSVCTIATASATFDESMPLRRARYLTSWPSFSASTSVTGVGVCTIQPAGQVILQVPADFEDCVRRPARRPRRAGPGRRCRTASADAVSRSRRRPRSTSRRAATSTASPRLAAVDDAGGDRAVGTVGDHDPLDQTAGDDGEVRPLPDGMQVGVGRAPAPAVVHGDRRRREAGLSGSFSSGVAPSGPLSPHAARNAAVSGFGSRSSSIHSGPSVPYVSSWLVPTRCSIRWK